MPDAFDAQLLNGPFGDPALLVDIPEARRTFLLDVGDLGALPPRKAMRVTDVLVSHAHMDHWCGFDRLLRLSLGRDRRIGIFGPPGIADRVGHKLRAYTWNLLDGYGNDLAFLVTEVGEDGPVARSAFRLRAGFARESPTGGDEAWPAREAAGSPVVLAEDGGLRVSATTLDHGTPCLAFAIEERTRANVWRNRLAELGLGVGPWLRELKALALAGAPDDTELTARWRGDDGVVNERACTLGEVAGHALTVGRGRKLAYVTDTAWTAPNLARAVGLARGADVLYVEAPFPDRDRERAARRHLTALQAGTLARLAGVARVVPFHFSPRHAHEEATLRAKVTAGFGGEASAALPEGAGSTDAVRS